MAIKAEGIWECDVLGASSGTDDRGVPTVQVNVRLTSGPSAGTPCSYEDQADARSALYVGRSLRAIGWRSRLKDDKETWSLTTVKEDVAAWIAKTGGKSTAEVKHIAIKNGRRAGEIWDKVNSIGRGPRVLKPITGEALADADEVLNRAMADDGGPPPDDVPHAATDDIPFATCSTIGLGEIAKVLR